MFHLTLILHHLFSQIVVINSHFSQDNLFQILPRHSTDYDVIYPQIYTEKIRKKRDINRNFHYEEDVTKKTIKFNEWILDLSKQGSLNFHSDFKVVYADEKLDYKETEKEVNECDFLLGKIRGLEDVSTVALSICDVSDIRGYIKIDGDSYLIEPFNVSGSDAHILYRTWHNRRKRSLNDVMEGRWEYFNLTGDTIDLDVEERDDDLFVGDVEEGNSTNILEYDLNDPEANANATSFIWETNHIEEENLGYFVDSAWESKYINRKKSGAPALSVPQWLEIALAVDHTVINFHGKNRVKQYVLSLMNIVNAIYQDPSLDANLQLVITRLFFYESKKSSVIRLGDAKKSLQNVNQWNRRLHIALAPNEPKHDIAVWLTRADIGGPSGYAPVSGVCDPKRSCTLNRDEGLTSAFIIAHEVAHTLGLSHDGEQNAGNTCGGDAFYGSIMAPMVSSTFDKFIWSDCSKKEYHRKTSKMSCLLNKPKNRGGIILNNTLQSTFTLDEQCRMEFGDGYTLCRSFDIIDVCSHLWCGHNKSPVVCKTKKGPPLEGTECGFDKWCINGYCEQVDSRRFGRNPVHHNPQNGDWSPWSSWGPCSRSCGTGVEFRMRMCDNPPPLYGGSNCFGLAEEWRVCTLDPCPEPLKDFRAQQCARLPEYLNFGNTIKGNMTWLPYESDEHDSKCKLICISKETRELYVTDENLMDGTHCSYESNSDICIQGACYNLGCDGVLYSNVKLDRCGICGGNNSECQAVKSSYHKKLKREVTRLLVIPRLARGIEIEANFSMPDSTEPSVAFLLKDRNKQSYSVSVPNKGPYGEIMAGTKFHYQKFVKRSNLWATGPLLSEMIVALFASVSDIDKGINISFKSEYYMNKKLLKDPPRYAWILGGWGPCSQSCGGGKRQKTAACFDTYTNKIIPRRQCSLIIKPHLEIEKCNTYSCNFYWVPGPWEPCSKTCGSFGIQFREIYCIPQSAISDSIDNSKFNNISEPWNYMVNPAKCGSIMPETARPCNRILCPVDWEYGEWSQCSTTCGPGFMTRQAHCPKVDDEPLYTCGPSTTSQKKHCKGAFTRFTNPLCKKRKKRTCIEDKSAHCSINLLAKYCRLNGFRKLCCKTCSDNKLTRIRQ